MPKQTRLTSNTKAPPADVPSLDLEKEFANITITPNSSAQRSRSRLSGSGTTSSPSPSSRKRLTSKGKGVINKLKSIPENATSSPTRRNNEPSRLHVPTKHAPLGNMERTYVAGLVRPTEVGHRNKRTVVKGMVPKSEYDRNKEQSYINHTNLMSNGPSNFISSAPPGVKSMYNNTKDLRMASRQTKINGMSGEERVKQEQWAQSMVQRTAPCPRGFLWTRRTDGYQCQGGNHYISDEHLSEGKGGMYILFYRSEINYRCGPYYPRVSDPTTYRYAGMEPRTPPWGPDYLDSTCEGYFDDDGNKVPGIEIRRHDIREASDTDVLLLAAHSGLYNMSPSQAREALIESCGESAFSSRPAHAVSQPVFFVSHNGRTVTDPAALSQLGMNTSFGGQGGSSHSHHHYSNGRSSKHRRRSHFDDW